MHHFGNSNVELRKEVLKSKFMHTLSESKSIFAIEQKAITLCFVKNVAFLMGHPVFEAYNHTLENPETCFADSSLDLWLLVIWRTAFSDSY